MLLRGAVLVGVGRKVVLDKFGRDSSRKCHKNQVFKSAVTEIHSRSIPIQMRRVRLEISEIRLDLTATATSSRRPGGGYDSQY